MQAKSPDCGLTGRMPGIPASSSCRDARRITVGRIRLLAGEITRLRPDRANARHPCKLVLQGCPSHYRKDDSTASRRNHQIAA